MNKKIGIIIGIAIIVCAVIAIFLHMNRSNDIVSTFNDAIENESVDQLEDLFRMEDNQLDRLILENFLALLLKDEKKLHEVITSIDQQIKEGLKDTTAVVQVNEEEKQYGIFPTYSLTLQKNQLQLEGLDLKDIVVKADNFTLNETKKGSFTYGPLYAGTHMIEVEFENELGTFHTAEEITVWKEDNIEITIDEEEIVRKDSHIMEELFEFAGLITKSLPEIPINEFDNRRLRMEDGIEEKLLNESSSILDRSTLTFQEASVEEASYHMFFIDHLWQSEVRLIAKYKDDKGKELYVLYEMDFVFNSYINEWVAQFIHLTEGEKSVLELWDSEYYYHSDDLKEGGTFDSVM